VSLLDEILINPSALIGMTTEDFILDLPDGE